MLQEYPSCGEEHPKQRHLSLPHANCGGNRAAIGSGGKKVSTSALRPYVKAGQLHCARHCEPRRQNGRAFFSAGERSEPSRREAWPQWGLGRSPKRPAGRVGGEQSDRQGAMRHRTPRARGQPLRAVRSRNVVRLFRPKGRNWTTRIYSGRPTVRLPQTEGRLAPEMAESHEARSQAQAQRRAWPQCLATWAAFVAAVPRALFGTFASKESTSPLGAAAPPPAP